MTILKRQLVNSMRNRLGALLMCLLFSGLAAGAQPPTPDVNTVESVQTLNGFVEIKLHSSREFPIRNEVVVLRIGTKEFLRSRSPADGSLKTLIFMIDPDDFAALADGEAMTVKYGKGNDQDGDVSATAAGGSAHKPRWDFGKLNKALHR